MFTQGRIRVVALGISDLLCICGAWTAVVCGYWGLGRVMSCLGIPHAAGGYTPAEYLQFWPVAICFVMLNLFFDNYHGSWMYPGAPLAPVEEMRRLFGASLLLHLVVIAFLVFRFQTIQGYSRVVIAFSGVVTALGAQSFRNWTRGLLLWMGWGQIPVVLAGGGDVAMRVASVLSGNPYAGFRVVGYFAGLERLGRRRRQEQYHDREFAAMGIPFLGTLRDILPEARKRDIKILLACQDERLFRRQMEEFTSWFTYIEYLPTTRTFPVFGARPVVMDGIGGLEMVNQGRMRAKRMQKLLLDNLLAVTALVASLPIFVLVPVLIRLTSRGPVFYRQDRLGEGGKKIRVWKFRSMYADAEARLARELAENPAAAAEWKANFKLAKDPRITPLGRLLRRTSLDELPQLFNVFSGEMALIGPRPIVEDEVPYYGDTYPVFSSVRPGITGLWQVSGRSDTDYTRRVALDAYYVLNWSPWMDMWIVIRTVYAVLFMRGAR